MSAEAERAAERARVALIDGAIAAYEDASVQGLCAEGAWEAAVSAMRRLDLGTPPILGPVGGPDGRSDFDFLFGSWTVRNRRLRQRLKGCREWEEFESRCRARPILGGLGNMDEFVLERASGRVEAITVRLYSPAAREWSIYWAAATGTGRFDLPMVGRFEGGRGEFFSQEVFEGRHILARFVWTVRRPDACRWEQAYSADGGKTWETNWTMAFSREP
jgi:hypothetical protein